VIWLLSAIVLAGALVRRQGLYLGACVALAYLSWKVQRITPFFALVTTVTALPAITVRPTSHVRDDRFRGSDRITAAVMCAIAVAISAVGWSAAATRSLSCITIQPDGPDQAAAQEIKRLELHGRMVTWFDWGEYAIWQFGPALQVSMDGRRETVYAADTLAQHTAFIRSGFEGWPELETLHPDYIWLPRNLPAAQLVAQRGWKPIISTPRSIVWARTSDIQPTNRSSPPLNERCFPG
jgi:hypothetical protein